MEDQDLQERIKALVEEERVLHERHVGTGLTPKEAERLREVEVGIDQCWDLLRQRRALRHAGRDPNQAQARDTSTVEHYVQ